MSGLYDDVCMNMQNISQHHNQADISQSSDLMSRTMQRINCIGFAQNYKHFEVIFSCAKNGKMVLIANMEKEEAAHIWTVKTLTLT